MQSDRIATGDLVVGTVSVFYSREMPEEDDGPFYAIVSAYGYWKLLDDDALLMQWYGTLNDSMNFLFQT